MNQTLINILAIIGAATLLYLIFKLLGLFSLINYALITKALGYPISLTSLILMKLRKVNIKEVVNAYIQLKKNGVSVDPSELEVADLMGKNVIRITQNIIRAKEQGSILTFKMAADEFPSSKTH